MEGCTKLRKLVIRGCDKLTDRSVIDVSKYLPHLVSLDVSACDRVTNDGLAPLGTVAVIPELLRRDLRVPVRVPRVGKRTDWRCGANS